MEVLILGATERQELLRIKQYAEENPFVLAEVLMAKQTGRWPARKIQSNYTCIIPMGFKVVLTVEELPEPIKHTWHLSISRPAPNHPSPWAAEQILKTIGLPVELDSALNMV